MAGTTPHQLSPNERRAVQIRVRGIVQGVGFRPTVWRVATALSLVGDVRNGADGVIIRCAGQPDAIDRLLDILRTQPPPNARIDSIDVHDCDSAISAVGFSVVKSVTDRAAVTFAPDIATCADCLDEISDRSQRRYRYPFTNCTACGPRLTIVERAPYDRANTTMRAFPMCSVCSAEYTNPGDRRYHAEPIACPACGPRLHLTRLDGSAFDGRELPSDAIEATALLLRNGSIVAIKGLGGFHLACDATHDRVIATLRCRKRRPAKPLGIMMRDLAMVARFCRMSEAEAACLISPAAPIVLLTRNGMTLPDGLAPGLDTLGVMLAYMPLHHLLLDACGRPLVMTSANIADEPQCIDRAEVHARLTNIADAVLDHDRRITHRVDDSVVRVINGSISVLRRARGFAPASIELPAAFRSAPIVMALGSELKNTICFLRDGVAHLSQHIGDLESEPAFEDYLRTIELQRSLHDKQPVAMVTDRHPEFLSTKHGRTLSETEGIRLIETQHHHAHIASCLADNGYPPDAAPVLGIVLDGLGYGDDGTIWGGEFLLANYASYQRLGRLKPVAMPGGAQAVREPWRNTYAHIVDSVGWTEFERRCRHAALHQFLATRPIVQLNAMLASRLNSPLASSCGRLFDAVAAAVGLVQAGAAYEGQGGAELEALAAGQLLAVSAERSAYRFDIGDVPDLSLLQIDSGPMWQQLLTDVAAAESSDTMAARFHLGLANAVVQMAKRLRGITARQRAPFETIALSGGCFQNKVLLEAIATSLQGYGVRVLVHRRVPANDGGVALGQAVIAASLLMKERST